MENPKFEMITKSEPIRLRPECCLCKTRYFTMDILEEHVRKKHPGFVRCQSCGTILKKDQIDRHLSEVHKIFTLSQHLQTQEAKQKIQRELAEQYAREMLEAKRKLKQERKKLKDQRSIEQQHTRKALEAKQKRLQQEEELKKQQKIQEQHDREIRGHPIIIEKPKSQREIQEQRAREIRDANEDRRYEKAKMLRGNEPIYLQSKHGTKVTVPGLCDECCTRAEIRWCYTSENCSKVYICSRCKDKVLDRAFGKIDALDFSVSGGGFETNRRKH